MRTLPGIAKSCLPRASVVFSDINDCQYSVSVTVAVIFGQVSLLRQRSSWPAVMPAIGSWLSSQLCGVSWPGNCFSVFAVPEKHKGCAKRTLKAQRLEDL